MQLGALSLHHNTQENENMTPDKVDDALAFLACVTAFGVILVGGGVLCAALAWLFDSLNKYWRR